MAAAIDGAAENGVPEVIEPSDRAARDRITRQGTANRLRAQAEARQMNDSVVAESDKRASTQVCGEGGGRYVGRQTEQEQADRTGSWQ